MNCIKRQKHIRKKKHIIKSRIKNKKKHTLMEINYLY